MLAAAPGAVVAPEWVQVFPLGPDIHANDGRFFRLVNRSPFKMAAIAAAQHPGDQKMNNIAAALGLPEGAPEETVLAKVNEGKTDLASAKMPPVPDKYMPRADFDTAIKDGKIAPASKAHYVVLA